MHLSAIGDMVQEEWNISFKICSESFRGAFVMMPNHMHAILRMETRATAKPIVAGFNSAVTKKINEYRQTPKMPVWQTRFHDHVIRSADEYERILHYIETNVENWENDPFYQPLPTQP